MGLYERNDSIWGIFKVRDCTPVLAKMAYRTNPTMNAATGGAGISGMMSLRPGIKPAPPTTKPTAQDIHPAGLNPARGPDHFLPARR